MTTTWDILVDLLIMLAAALVLGTLAERLRQSAILGYLLAGTLVGPNVLGFVGEGAHVKVIAELGVALLLFTIGLEFSLPRLRRLGRVALIGGSAQVIVTMGGAAIVAGALGLPARGAVAVGAMVALSSTACVLRLLVERGAVDSLYGRNAVGILLLQDLAVIPLMLLLVTLGAAQAPLELAVTAGKVLLLATVLIGGFLLLFKVAIPRLLSTELLTRNRELLILMAIVLALGSAVAAHEASLSPAMGAFVAGVLLGESPFAAQIRADVGSLRTILLTLFFASIGMLGEPQWVAGRLHLVAATVLMILAGKALVVWVIVRAIGFGSGMAAATGLCLCQVGEFSFVLAGMAHEPQALIGDDTFKLIVSATIATLFLTPLLIGAAPHVAGWIEAGRRRGAAGAAPVGRDHEAERSEILVIGFGPAGQALAQALYASHRQHMSVLELNPRNALVARRLGLKVHVGDATHRDILEHAEAGTAQVIAVTIPDPDECRRIVHLCRHLSPGAQVVVRARYHTRRWELELAGAREVVDEEEQVGLRMAALARRYLSRDETPATEPGGPDAG